MRVKHLRVQNFTSLVDVDLRDLPNLVVLIGKNSSGKSNLIDALALLFFELGADAQRELGTAEEFEHLFPGHNTQTDHAPRISATVDLTLDEWESVTSAGGDTPSQWAGISLVLTRRLVIENGIARWESNEVALDEGELDGEGEPKPQELILPPETEGGPRRTVSLDEFRSRLAELLRSGLQVIHTTDNPRDWPNRVLTATVNHRFSGCCGPLGPVPIDRQAAPGVDRDDATVPRAWPQSTEACGCGIFDPNGGKQRNRPLGYDR